MKPLTPVSPGEILETEFLTNISPERLSSVVKLPQETINGVIAGTQRITTEIDIALCNYYKLSAGYWLRLQAAYDERMNGQYEWPRPNTRPPRASDGDDHEEVLARFSTGRWGTSCWQYVAEQKYSWLHLPSWVPKPEKTLKEKALEALGKDPGCGYGTMIPSYNYNIIRDALNLLPDQAGLPTVTTPVKP